MLCLTPVVHTLARELQLALWSAPPEVRALALLNLFYGAGPATLLYVGKVVIDETARLVTAPRTGAVQVDGSVWI